MVNRAHHPKRTKKKATKKKVVKRKAVKKKAVVKKVVATNAAFAQLEAAGASKEVTKQAALEAIDKKLQAAGDIKAKCRTLDCDQKMDQCIADLGAQSTAIYDQAYVAAIDDPDFAKAIAAIKQATKAMNAVAPNMASATSFISSLAGFFTAAGKVVPALKGLS